MSRLGFAGLVAAIAVLFVGLVSIGSFIGPKEEQLPKMRQTRLYFPEQPGDAPIAPPRVTFNNFPGPLP
jgi:hypothetical protein